MKNSRGTEVKIIDFPQVNLVFGSIDKNNPKTIYIKISAWVNPIDYDGGIDYGSVIRRVDKNIRTALYNSIDVTLFNNELNMVYLDIRQSGILKNKSSFMSCEITLCQNNNYLLASNIIDIELKRLSSIIIKEVFLPNEYFKFYENKKEAKLNLKQNLIN